ncbi:hypothetical protein FSP39_017553, partial [Pinctada imbricata]
YVHTSGKLEKEIERIFEENCHVTLGYIKPSTGKKFGISSNIPFGCKDLDVLILELVGIEAEHSPKYPRRYILNSSDPISTDHLHVLAHPDGSVLKSDLNCHLLTEEDRKYIKNNKIEKWREISTRLSVDEIERVYKNLLDCTSNQQQVLFNVSKSTTHGASGAPCIVERNNIQVVFAMLIKGYPNFFFNNLTKREQEEADPKLLVEACLPMAMVSKALKEKGLIDLQRDLYKPDVDEGTFGYKRRLP